MKLRFGQIEETLQVAHDVPADAQTQFRARLRHLFRSGLSLPSGQVGRRANFHAADLFKMAFAVELLQSGILPERTAIAVMQYWPDAVELMFAARDEAKSRKVSRRFLVAAPSALTNPHYRFKRETLESLSARLVEGRRLLILDVTGMFVRTLAAARQIGLDMEALNASLDADQTIILEQGARVGPGIASGFINPKEGG